MKKTFAIIALLITLISCRKDLELGIHLSDDLLLKAQEYHNNQIRSSITTKHITSSSILETASSRTNKILKPIWDEAKEVRISNGFKSIVVPSTEFKLSSRKIGLHRIFLFSVDKDQITNGKIIEFYGSPDYIEKNKTLLISKYTDDYIPGFEGTIITYDLKYRQIGGRLYENGIKSHLKTKIVQGKEGSQNRIKEGDGQCYDVYLVTTYEEGGYSYTDYQYLYSYCDSDGETIGGGGGGSAASSQELWENCYNSALSSYISDIEHLADIRDSQVADCYAYATGGTLASILQIFPELYAVLAEARQTQGASLATIDPQVAGDFLNDIIQLYSTSQECVQFAESTHFNNFWSRYYQMQSMEAYCNSQYPH